jgi:RNA polymerase sigma-70 factor (ECF subfamily)
MRFPSTDWSLIASAREPSRWPAREPLAEICSQYWHPVYAYLRQRGHRAEAAEDLTQGFFMHVIDKRVIERAAPERGRLRTLLLTCLANYVANEQERRRAIKRGGPQPPERPEIDARVLIEPSDHMTPERIYEMQWAITLLRRVLNQLRAEFVAAGKDRVFATLKTFLTGERTDTGYRQAAASLNISEAAARVTVHRLRRRYRELLWREVAATLCGNEQDVDGEINYLLSIVQSRWSEGGKA